jgi:hypothetical protein
MFGQSLTTSRLLTQHVAETIRRMALYSDSTIRSDKTHEKVAATDGRLGRVPRGRHRRGWVRIGRGASCECGHLRARESCKFTLIK